MDLFDKFLKNVEVFNSLTLLESITLLLTLLVASFIAASVPTLLDHFLIKFKKNKFNKDKK